ncbi:uncharacterized protein PRCAT00005383001 [Priceomyces carsonii]|uniref:uncharacterized protein n=1 Tax=Priceomyces carsonii TaxID=28549 RepID=UPI002EDB8BAD|nr:unnamed protein product [Priceomyces carsonii]
MKEANYGTKTASGNPRIYICKKCDRAFTREEHLTRHTLSTHNKLKPFTCGICSRPFSRRDLLLRHAKNLHQGSEMAVSRIRKLNKRHSDTMPLDKDINDGSTSLSLPRKDSDSSSSNDDQSVSSIDSDYDDDKKRIKISVDMLVS